MCFIKKMFLEIIRNIHRKIPVLQWHGVKVGPGPQELEPRNPGPPSKFKSETRDPLNV